MFTENLFDHKYDIDTIIAAFCGDNDTQKWCLNTRNGELKAIDDNSSIVDGSDKNHIHIIESLPLSFLCELTANAKFNKLTEEVKLEVQNITQSATNIYSLMDHFDEGDAGAYIVKFIKGACLDWLDMRNLIPPSMRHTGDMSMFDSLGSGGEKVKINISTT